MLPSITGGEGMMYKYKILLVDDEEEIRQSMIQKMQWEALGYELVGDAENGEDALEKIRGLEPDLVLTDIKMPYMDGLQLAEHIKRERSSTEIIIFSGFDDFEYAQQAMKLGVIEYILKPVNVEELSEILKRLKVKMDKQIEEKYNIEVLRNNYKKMLPVLKSHFLNDLIQGKVKDNQIAEDFKRLELTPKRGPFWVVATTYVELAEMNQDREIIHLNHERNLIPVSIGRMIEEKLSGVFEFESFGTATGICVLCGLKTAKDIEELINKFNQVCADCKRILKLDVTIGLGNAYDTVEKIKTSYDEAKDALGYRTTIGNGITIYVDDVEVIRSEKLQFNESDESELIQSIKFGNREEISYVVDKLMEKMKEAKVHTSQHQFYIIAILNTIMEMVQKYEIDTYDIWGKEDYVQVIGRLFTLENIRNFIMNSALFINDKINRERTDTVKHLIIEAKKYIHENFSNSELTVEMVCSHLHISQAYFSTLFKKETGQTYISYLTEIRLAKAVELLNKTDDKTYIIAKKVGYIEPNYFSYVFKKKFGVAPSRYQGRGNGNKG